MLFSDVSPSFDAVLNTFDIIWDSVQKIDFDDSWLDSYIIVPDKKNHDRFRHKKGSGVHIEIYNIVIHPTHLNMTFYDRLDVFEVAFNYFTRF